MPIDDFSSDTFVAFTDIAGFKAMMHDGKRGAVALDVLYSEGYKIIGKQPECGCRVEGFFVSDCGVLFVREFESAAGRLEALLNAVERLNRACFERDDCAVFFCWAWRKFTS